MKSQVRNMTVSSPENDFPAQSDGKAAALSLSDWLDGQLAELEERNARFVTRQSLARHFGSQWSGRRSD